MQGAGVPPAGPLTAEESVAWMGAWRLTPSLEALRHVTRHAGQVAPAIARRAGLSHTELRTLELLTGRAWTPRELAAELGVTGAAVSGIVDRLAARGHAERSPNPSDGRSVQVAISVSGRAEVLAHLLPMFEELRANDARFSEAERELVARYLQGAGEAIDRLL